MMINEAMRVFWQTVRDTWEELYSIAIVNLVWLLSLLPFGLGASAASSIPILFLLGALVSLMLFPIATAGMYYVTYRVARGKTFGFSDFREGIRIYWWRSLIWFLANIVLLAVIVPVNINFYTSGMFQGWVGIILGGFWIAVSVWWLAVQMYFWPMMIQQEKPKILLAWRNAIYLVMANPFFAFFMAVFTIVLIGISVGLVLPLIFIGMALVGLLHNNAALTLLEKFKVIKEARPKP